MDNDIGARGRQGRRDRLGALQIELGPPDGEQNDALVGRALRERPRDLTFASGNDDPHAKYRGRSARRGWR